MIYLAADHGGLKTKEKIKEWLKKRKLPFKDLGNTVFDENDDYPDFAVKVAQKISEGKHNDFGILVCRSGHGMDMLANKFFGVRAALCFTQRHAEQSRQHENANVLCLANDYLSEEEIRGIVYTFLTTQFSFGERHKRRLQKMRNFEQENFR